jgi:hypothetical protein
LHVDGLQLQKHLNVPPQKISPHCNHLSFPKAHLQIKNENLEVFAGWIRSFHAVKSVYEMGKEQSISNLKYEMICNDIPLNENFARKKVIHQALLSA